MVVRGSARDIGHEILGIGPDAVSYTHLDVYKRQGIPRFSDIRADACSRVTYLVRNY